MPTRISTAILAKSFALHAPFVAKKSRTTAIAREALHLCRSAETEFYNSIKSMTWIMLNNAVLALK
jgi:hypothetical protein